MPHSFSHVNEAWSFRLMQHLYVLGVRHICIAPGSRSAPLTLAAENYSKESPELQLHSHFDERGLAFFALGIAKSTRTPVAVITTSGTAVANLLPAVIEAFQTQVPLILLTADRPDELLNCGANQAIQQKNIFGKNVVAYSELPTPSKNLEPFDLDNKLLSVVQNLTMGPVHINCPFRDPLYGVPGLELEQIQQDKWRSAVSISISNRESDRDLDRKPNVKLSSVQVNKDCLSLVLIGNIPIEESLNILEWAEKNNLAVVADIASGLRQFNHPNILPYPELTLATASGFSWFQQFEQIIQFGGRFVGKRLNQWLGTSKAHYFIVNHYDADPHHKAAHIKMSTPDFCEQYFSLSDSLSITDVSNKIEAAIDDVAVEFSEITLARTISKNLSAHFSLFAGNSLSIRWLDIFSKQTDRPRNIYCNRGASGIDGLIATGAGVETGTKTGTLLLIGDTSALHDLNSLALVSAMTSPFIIVIINNQGGGIFNLLPVNKIPETNKHFFRCEHVFDFKNAAQMFHIPYNKALNLLEFSQHLESGQLHQGTTIIECGFSSESATIQFREILDSLENL